MPSGSRVPAGALQMLMSLCLLGFLQLDCIKMKDFLCELFNPASGAQAQGTKFMLKNVCTVLGC